MASTRARRRRKQVPATVAMPSDDIDTYTSILHEAARVASSHDDTALASPSGTGLQPVTGPQPLGAYSKLKILVKDSTTGKTTIRMLINERGVPTEIRVVTSLTPDLDSQAMSMARRFRFRPCKNDAGVPVPCTLNWTFHVQTTTN